MQRAYRTIDVVRRQPARDHDPMFARDLPGLRPRPGSPGAADRVRHPGVEERMVAVFEGDGGQVFAVLDAEGRKQQQAERAILIRQRPVDLDRGQATGPRDLVDLLRRLIDEDADPLHARRHLGDHILDLLRANLSFAVGEDEPEQVGTQLDGQFHIVGPGVSADLDLCHDSLSSRTLASRSAARSSDSPTISKTASAPTARAASTWMGSMMKSLQRTGTSTAERTACRWSRLPPKNSGSASTEMAAAPFAA